MPEAGSDPFIVLARVGAPNGVRGAARVKLFGEDASGLTAYGPLRRADGKGTLRVLSLRPGKTPDMVVATFEGVDGRDAAAALNGVELGLPRSALPVPDDEDDFYHADLIGLEVRLTDGARFGSILQVANYGADDLLDVKPDRGGPSVLVPFTKAIVPEVRLADGYVTVDAPEGLLDPPGAKPDEAGDV
ncbi:MAG: 16S rRNA processing protein RimM [Devosiaceae bacterium]|nr:16S rRNA processing protein RimM [Devosiaceae bacterium MH13]